MEENELEEEREGREEKKRSAIIISITIVQSIKITSLLPASPLTPIRMIKLMYLS